MSPIAAYANTPAPVPPIQAVTGRSGGESENSSESRFQASDAHSHGELASTCPTCGHTLNLSV
jgi:hypothetical protein